MKRLITLGEVLVNLDIPLPSGFSEFFFSFLANVSGYEDVESYSWRNRVPINRV